jgi:cytoskeletal protein RodZ
METMTLDLNGETIGNFLERKRKEQGVSLREISNKTCIGIRYLEFIEKGEFHKLPCRPYNRGFVSAYAACIGLDSKSVMGNSILK